MPDDRPTIAGLGEFGLIAQVTRDRVQPRDHGRSGRATTPRCVAAPDGRVVATTDVLVDGRALPAGLVHARAGRGARPRRPTWPTSPRWARCRPPCSSGWPRPPDTPVETVAGLADGLWAEAAAVGAGLVGGDVVTSATLTLAVTALGSLEGRAPVTRSGARPGDVVALAGRLGWAAAGLAVLQRGFRSPGVVVAAHRVPEPPYAAGPAAAAAGATAMIDVSDGLLADLGHIAAASGVVIDVRRRLRGAAEAARGRRRRWASTRCRWLLTGGEDHALVATFPADAALPPGFTPIGEVRAGDAAVLVEGRPYDGDPGWTHFG